LSDVKIIMQCVIDKINRVYKGGLRKHNNAFS
jgi:hypothetical protein